MSKLRNKCIGITLGDPTGIGPEVTAKALSQSSVNKLAKFVLIGDSNIFQQYRKTYPKNCQFIDAIFKTTKNYRSGRPTLKSAQASLSYLDKAIELIQDKHIDSLVTAPICKETINRIHPHFRGHTEHLAKAFKVDHVDMMFIADKLRTVIVTRHIPVKDISASINAKKVFQTICLSHKTLKNTFGIKNPSLAVCGLNPHAGEGGTIGNEELQKIIPAIKKARQRKIAVQGPFPADTLFTDATSKIFDVIIAMYHDQGLIPIKAKYFTKLVNLTIGLPFIRTSPAHGTAFDIAGQDQANPSSMAEAIKLAAKLTL